MLCQKNGPDGHANASNEVDDIMRADHRRCRDHPRINANRCPPEASDRPHRPNIKSRRCRMEAWKRDDTRQPEQLKVAQRSIA